MGIRHVIFDVDDVFVNMYQAEFRAEDAVGHRLRRHLSDERAAAVHQRFVSGFATLRAELERVGGQAAPAFVHAHARTTEWQRDVTAAGHPVKLWSRDALLAIALEADSIM